ncbi:putative ion channel CASTOR [Capsicum galapagoense]
MATAKNSADVKMGDVKKSFRFNAMQTEENNIKSKVTGVCKTADPVTFVAVTKMSFNPDTPSTINPDWIYPSQPFNLPRTSARRFSSPYPRTTLFQNSLSPPPPPPPPPSNSNNTLSPPPPSNSTSPLRRRISHQHRIVKQEISVRDEIHDKSNDVAAPSENCLNPGNSSLG